MQHTPLHERHVAHGAKLVDFAGWHMPIQYGSVLEEYHAVRQHVGLFDVSHMGRLIVEGDGALALLQRMTTNDVAKVDILGSQYSMVCNEQGGVKDDVFVYRFAERSYLVCVNASNREKIYSWFTDQQRTQSMPVTVEDRSQSMAQIAVQGPASRELLVRLGDSSIAGLKLRRCLQTTLAGISLLLTRTGYTGELGYELYVPAEQAEKLWSAFMKHGEGLGIKPAGLGARDLLRLDMGYYLYGNDLTEDTTPIEAGAEWVVKFDKGDFIGKAALEKQQHNGLLRKFIAFELLEKAVPRHDMRIFSDDQEIGQVTSGNLSPVLQKGIGLGYVVPSMAEIGTKLFIDIRGRRVPAMVVALPFYKRKPMPSA